MGSTRWFMSRGLFRSAVVGRSNGVTPRWVPEPGEMSLKVDPVSIRVAV